jgi:glutaredoxin
MANVSQVKIYSTTVCPYCKMEKEYLSSKGVSFVEVLVDQDPKAVEEMLTKSNQLGVPFTEVTFDDGSQEFILGFDEARLDQVLNLA